jgi:hypothetical protein
MRRFLTVLGGATAAAALALGPAGPASAHDGFHNVEISGHMDILDDESWPFSDERAFVPFNGTVTVGPFNTTRSYSTSGCAGDEVRIELRVDIEDSTSSPGWVLARATARMYEGTDCFSGDFDGQAARSFWVPRNGTSTQTFRVNNTAEGGDYADLKVVVRNTTT